METTESILIWRGGEGVEVLVSPCGRTTKTVTVEQAAAAMDVSTHSIQTWIESGHLHTCESAKGMSSDMCCVSGPVAER